MFYELLMALNGYPGSIFIPNKDGIMKMRKDITFPFVHPGEVAVIDEILEVGTMYKALQEFVGTHQLLGVSNKEQVSRQGLYVTAAANGIHTILNDYLDLLTDLEMRLIQDLNLTFNYLRAAVEKYREIFMVLMSLVSKIRTKTKSSCVILDIIRSEYNEKAYAQDHLKKLIPWVNDTLYKQITNWVVYGTLSDPYDEFFVRPKRHDGQEGEDVTVDENKLYYVDFEVAPSYFPVNLTDKILFIGNTISILERSNRTKSVVMEQQQMFHSRMKSVNRESFRIEPLSEAIDELAGAIGTVLHKLIVSEAGLMDYLEIIKEIYLTGRGELFHDFLSTMKATKLTKHSFASLFKRSFAVSASQVQFPEHLLQKVELKVYTDGVSDKMNLSECIPRLGLDTKYDWPLEIFFTPECKGNYNKLFKFLLRIRLHQLELNNLWVNTRKVFRFPVPGGPAELRNIMSFFIDHLQHYLQEDVLGTQYAILVSSIERSETFEQIREAHINFQSAILSQSFQSNKKVLSCVEDLLKLCGQFTQSMEKHILECEENDEPVNEGITPIVEKVSSDFKKYIELLLIRLKSLASRPQTGQFLGQFLLRLDFNSYFTTAGDV